MVHGAETGKKFYQYIIRYLSHFDPYLNFTSHHALLDLNIFVSLLLFLHQEQQVNTEQELMTLSAV